MTEIIAEVVMVLVLILVNGVFAMAEIAIVSARKGRLRNLSEQGDSRATIALELAESPARFLSTVQIGITLVGILAGAYGGVTLSKKLAQPMAHVSWLAPYANQLAFGVVVVAIAYCSLVLGELAPKRIGLGNPEGIALAVARLVRRLSVLGGPVVTFLSKSTDALLHVFGVRPQKEAVVSAEEVKVLMREGVRAGAFNKVESQIVHSALDLDQLVVRTIMTPRPKIIWLNRDDPHEAIWHKIVVSGHSNFPVYEGNRDQVVGIVSVKAIYANLAAGTAARIADLMTKPLIVPTTQTVIQLLDTFKQTGRHIALVTDEFGSIVGLVTLNDVVEAIVGELPSQEDRSRPEARKREDGTWLIDAMIETERVEAALPGFRLSDQENKDYQTLAGFIVKHLGHVPREGETFEAQGYIFEVLDMDSHRVDKVLVIPPKPPP